VTRYLLDTNVISNITRPVPSDACIAWMAEQADEDLFISSMTIAEIRRAVLEKPAGKKRRELEALRSRRTTSALRRSGPPLR